MDNIKQTYNTIDKTLNRFRWVAIIAIGSSLLLALIMSVFIYKVSTNNMLAIDRDGDIVSAKKVNESEYFEIEADNHVRLFYSRFFTYNRNNYRKQIELGIYLCGESSRRLYETFKQKGWYDAVVNEHLNIESDVIGSVEIKPIGKNKLSFFAKGFQIVSKGELTEKRHLDIKGTINKTNRIKGKNPHGLEIDDIVIVNNNLFNTNIDNE